MFKPCAGARHVVFGQLGVYLHQMTDAMWEPSLCKETPSAK